MALSTLNADTDFGALVEATTTIQTLTINPNRSYDIHHTALDNAGAAATGDVVIGLGTTIAATDRTEARNKMLLKANTVITVMGFSSLYIDSISGSPMLNIDISPVEGL